MKIDHSKVDVLKAILPEEKRDSERMAFLINSYMRYRLSGFHEIEKPETNKSDMCSEYFTFCGTESELKERLLSFMSEEDSHSFINGVQDYS